MSQLTGLVVSDFNAENLALLLSRERGTRSLSVKSAPFGQVYQSLDVQSGPIEQAQPDFLVVWTRPEAVISTYARALSFEHYEEAQALDKVDAFADQVLAAAQKTRFIFVMTWAAPPGHRGAGLANLRPTTGPGFLLLRMNLRLAERLAQADNVYLLDVAPHMIESGSKGFSAKSWYLGKIPYSIDLFKRVAADIRAGIGTLTGENRKLIVVDLDNTLWGGVVGDDGWENLALGGHSARGEAYVDFQRELRALKQRGLILAIASKNDEATALHAIDHHPEMVLRRSDFVAWRINWEDKAQNLADLARELNIGLQSVVFIDDNPVERARVAEALPEVLVPDWPTDCTQYCGALRSLSCFDAADTSTEDRGRTQLYKDERERKELRSQVGSVSDWLKELDTRVHREELNAANLPRATQLLNKTNQMNLSTRRLTSAELVAWAGGHGHAFFTFRVCDKFGDAGVTGLLGLSVEESTLHVIDFVLSCRVMGRKVEETMLATAVEYARQRQLSRVQLRYLPTPKNHPCLEFMLRSGLEQVEEGVFAWNCTDAFPYPEQVQVITEAVA